MIKKITTLFTLSILLLGQYAIAQEALTQFTIDLNGFSLGKEVILRGNKTVLTAVPEADGIARLKLSLASPSYFILSISTSENRIYLKPGEDLKATLIPEIKEIKGKERKLFNLSKLQLKFEGKSASINKYLNEFRMERVPDQSFLLSQSDYIKEVEKVIENNRQQINTFDLNKQFKEREIIRMKYQILEGVTRYPIQHYWKGGNQLGIIYDHGEDMSIIHNYLSAELKDDKELWEEESYRVFFGRAIGTLTGLHTKKDRDKMFLKRLERVTSLIKSKVILEDYVQELALNYVESSESESIGPLENAYKQYVQRKDYHEALNKAKESWKKSTVGTEFSNEEAAYVDVDGKAFDLAALKGKYVYIDIWATWCGPCRQELPYLKKLEEKFHGKNIAFVSISVDNRLKDWARMVKQNEMAGIQLYGGPKSPIMTDYQIAGSPRFFLIDKEGKIINANMTRPSDPATERALNELEGI